MLEVKWNILNIYGAPQDVRSSWLSWLPFVPKTRTIHCRGNFNVHRFSSEKNKNFHPNRFSDTFNAIIHVNELRELEVSGGTFTWSNNQADPTMEKLDRILMNRRWELLFPTAHAYKEVRGMSDHNTLILSSQTVNIGGRRVFRFELSWLRQPEFFQKVKAIWCAPTRDESSLDRVLPPVHNKASRGRLG
jgi:hypothetical protein